VANINVTFDASTVAQPGDYYATINVKTSDPQKATYGVPVTMTVTAPATYGKLMGTVNGLQRCDVAPGTALADTDLVIEASNGMTWTTSTDTGGAYSLWLNQAYRPYTVTAAHTGYLTGLVSGLLITGQVTTTHNFDLRLLAPCASVPETEINSTQMSNQVATQTLHINNAGAASLNWNIQEAAPTSAVSAPSGNTSRIRLFEPNVDLSGWLNALLPLANIVSDGGFEAGTPSPYWNEYSSNFGTPLCTSAACGGTGGGTGPHTGTWWGWFGGIDTAVETGYLTQTVVITAGSAATLTFWLEIPASAGNGTDWMTVKMDNTPIFTATDLTTGYSPYAQVSLNVSTFANGQPRALKFESTTNGGAVTNFFVDDVVLDVTAGGPPPVGTCQAEAIPWLTAVPVSGTTPADSGSLVNLVFNSTGLVSGVYTGTLCVNTSDAGLPQALLPVTMTVANPPVCDFTSSSPDDLGQTTTFNNLTVGDDPLVYRWDFGDGSPLSAAISPTHQYAQVGLYTVVMTATNNEGVDVCSGQVSIESVPIPSFTALPTRVNQPMVFNNTTLSNPPVTSWQWNFGDPASGSNNFSFAQSPTHTYSAAGTYTVTLIATNLKGLAQYQSAVLVVPVRIHLPLIMK
jgi:PKD repeat protein